MYFILSLITVQLSVRAKHTDLRSAAKACPSSVLTTRPFSMSHLLATMTVGIPGRHIRTHSDTEWCNGCCGSEEEQTAIKIAVEMNGIIKDCSVVVLSLSLYLVSICHLQTYTHRPILRVHAWGEISELRPIKAGRVTLMGNSAIR